MHSSKRRRWRRWCCVLPSLHFPFTVYVQIIYDSLLLSLWIYTYAVHLFGCRRRRRRDSLFRRRVSRGGQVFIGIFQPVVFHLNKRDRAKRVHFNLRLQQWKFHSNADHRQRWSWITKKKSFRHNLFAHRCKRKVGAQHVIWHLIKMNGIKFFYLKWK